MDSSFVAQGMSSIEGIQNLNKSIRYFLSRRHNHSSELSQDQVPDQDPIPPTERMVAIGTVKIHGTNAGVSMHLPTGRVEPLSKTRVISPEQDNFGFAAWYNAKKLAFNELFYRLGRIFPTECGRNEYLTIYGEWAGPGVQKGIGTEFIAAHDENGRLVPRRRFFIYGVAFKHPLEEHRQWVDNALIAQISDNANDIYNLNDESQFPRFPVEFDPQDDADIRRAFEEMTKMADSVDAECPVAAYFKQQGLWYVPEERKANLRETGEGIVFVGHYAGERFTWKCKGLTHRRPPRESKQGGEEECNSVEDAQLDELAALCLSEDRLTQGMNEMQMRNASDEVQIKPFIGWIVADVEKECQGFYEQFPNLGIRTIVPAKKNKLQPIERRLRSRIETIARKFFFRQVN